MAKLRLGLLFGGRSVEHEVSLSSATSILRALDPTRYDVTLISVGHDGRWRLGAPSLPAPAEQAEGREVRLPAAPNGGSLVPVGGTELGASGDLDLIFPIIHGRGGEDGSLQGLLELADVPYVGSGVLGSALQMDTETAKRLLHAAGLPVTPWLCVRARELTRDSERVAQRALDALSLPLFVKPANSGSSIGITRVAAADELIPALREAARYDDKLLIERGVDARELEVAVLGGDPLEASVPGEIRTGRDFYDYEAKYVDEDTELIVPAELTEEQIAEIRRLAVEAVAVLEGEGLGRVDFLMERSTGKFYINEVNSLPGFTESSMYPRLWEASGLSYPALLERLIELALERHSVRSKLETLFRSGT